MKWGSSSSQQQQIDRGLRITSGDPYLPLPGEDEYIYYGKTYKKEPPPLYANEARTDETGRFIGEPGDVMRWEAESNIARDSITPEMVKNFQSDIINPSSPWGPMRWRKVPSDWTDITYYTAPGMVDDELQSLIDKRIAENPSLGKRTWGQMRSGDGLPMKSDPMAYVANALLGVDSRIQGEKGYVLTQMYDDEFEARVNTYQTKQEVAKRLAEAENIKAQMEETRQRDLQAKAQKAQSYQKTAVKSRALLAGASLNGAK